MGRIKSTLIKRTARELVIKVSDMDFTVDFGKNKKLLGNLMPSKRLRNKIAGQIVRLQKAKISESSTFSHPFGILLITTSPAIQKSLYQT